MVEVEVRQAGAAALAVAEAGVVKAGGRVEAPQEEVMAAVG